MQVDPIKPRLKATGTKPFRLKYDNLLSRFAVNFNLCRYIVVINVTERGVETRLDCRGWFSRRHLAAGAYTRPLFGST